MEPLSFSTLTLMASLCMPPKRVDVFPYVLKREEVALSYPMLAGMGIPFGPPIIGVLLEYQFGLGKVRKAAIAGPQSDVYKKVNQVLEPRFCTAVG